MIPKEGCQNCDANCNFGCCWGAGFDNCQKFSRIGCSEKCFASRCFKKGANDCCHSSCIGGCSGPTARDCYACKDVNDDGECKPKCTSRDGERFAYGSTCYDDCPEHFLKLDGVCVKTCPVGYLAKNGKCVRCDSMCPKKCIGTKLVHSGNIDSYTNCTKIEGSLEILDQTFNGFQQVYSNFSFGPRYISVPPSKLSVFSNVKVITGYLKVHGNHHQFKNLKCFENLEAIQGHEVERRSLSLLIENVSFCNYILILINLFDLLY